MMRLLSEQRDLYAYLHDQTLRLANQGHTGIEIAEMIQLPPALDAAWHARGYYGSVSHNVKAVFSGISAGSTATRQTCGSTRRWRPPSDTPNASAASTPS